MDKICYGKWTAWIAPVVMLLLSLFYVITAQPDFLSISCGAKTNHTADNNITWITDAHYIDVGQSVDDIGNFSEQAYGSYLHSSRYFPEPLNKSCYQLPVAPDVPYLLRLWFPPCFGVIQPSTFTFSIETVDMLAQRNLTLDQNIPILYEFILVTKGRVLYICLVRSDNDDPYISAIEMRRLQKGMYIDAQPGTILVTLSRYDVGGDSTVRYPQDKFDRIWRSDLEASSDIHNISSKEPISTNNANDLPPTAVLQTAWVVNSPGEITLISGALSNEADHADRTLLLLYFAEIQRLNMSQSRSFLVSVDGFLQRETITLRRNYSAQEFTIYPDTAANSLDLLKSSDSTLPPIINAFEYYAVHLSDQKTDSEEIDALNAIKSRFDIKDWISPDPCYLIPWDGISCDNSSISELNLSGRNLTGAVPGDIALLSTLVTLSLAHNHLTGPLPNLTTLIMLQGLYLQNNNLNETLEFLSYSSSPLRELSLDHNGFTGPMPIWANLSGLERLNLQNNNLNGTLEWLSSLENLREVSLNHNQFTGPVPNLASADKLERL